MHWQRLAQMMLKDGNPALALRITVENGGCHGFQYLMSLETRSDTMEPAHTNPSSAASAAKPASPATTEDKDEWDDEANEDALDTVFEAADGTGARVVMDGMALRLLRDSKVHFTSELIGSQFKIVDNPAATSSCGCGTSFDAKLDAL